MIRFNTRVDFNINELLSRSEIARRAAQMMLDQEVLKDSNYYVRKRTGELERSSIRASQIGKGILIWDTKYARKVYFDDRNISRDVNPNARALWFEVAKSARKTNWNSAVLQEYINFFRGR